MIFKHKTHKGEKERCRYFQVGLQRLSEKLPEQVYGNVNEPKKMLYKIYGEGYDEEAIKKHRYEMTKKYFLVFAGVVILVMSYFLNEISVEDILKYEEGVFFIERPEGEVPIRVELIAEGIEGEERFSESVRLSVRGEDGKKEEGNQRSDDKIKKADAIKGELRKYTYEISNSTKGKRVILPVKLANVTKITWKEKRDNTPVWIIFIAAIGFIGIYAGRNEKFRRKLKECNDSIEEDLPGFLNKMVLLMNSGMVFSSAFQRAVEGEERRLDMGTAGYFYEELKKIRIKVKETKTPLPAELKKFAERSENREWMRVVNVIGNNVERGTELIQVLEAESSLLWFKRKKRAEEKAKMAETKMSLPLAIQLFVLITITLAPAMLEMR